MASRARPLALAATMRSTSTAVLVAAEHLVNGTTISQAERVDRLEYFNIEFDAQEVIFAEGAPAESYVDCDNRLMFANGCPSTRAVPGRANGRAGNSARRGRSAMQPEVETIRGALLERAGALG